MTGSYSDPDDLFRPAPRDPVPSTWFGLTNDLSNLWRDRPAVRVYHTGTQSIPDSAWTALIFNSENYDTQGMHSANGSQLLVPSSWAGRYSMGGNNEWDASSLGTLRGLGIRVNGTASLDIVQVLDDNAIAQIGSGSAVAKRQAVATQFRLAVGDYIELMVWHNRGSALLSEPNAIFAPSFWCQWEGP